MEEIIKELNNLKILQKSGEWVEDLPEELYEKYFKRNCIDEEIDIEKHRWYETSISVYDTSKGLIGVRHASQLYSESSMWEDLGYTIKFFEMESFEIITFRKKYE